MQQDLLDNNFNLTSNARSSLKSIALWIRYAAILAFASQVINIFVNDKEINLFAIIITPAITVFLNIFLLLFATKLLKALETNDQYSFSQSFQHLKIYFIIVGVFLLLVALIFVISVLSLIVFDAVRR
jgi:hypothetical protein